MRQYEDYRLQNVSGPAITPRIRGRLTLGENLADQGGVTLTHEALELLKREERARQSVPELAFTGGGGGGGGEEIPSHLDFLQLQAMHPSLSRLTEDQLFFLGYAQGRFAR